MSLLGVGKRRRLAFGVAASMVLSTITGLTATEPAQARHHHHRHHLFHRYGGGGGGYQPPFSAIIVDAKTGKVLYSADAKGSRHPASITKVMTLFLLFEQLERGAMTMETRLRVSEHAASMAPTKLGLAPGDTIAVSDAIKAIVTKSANDMAVAVAENIAGSEEAFAALMTRKAHALGMNDTQFVNASGLPDDQQLTTAYDLSILARAIQERFPRYYPVFATRSFYYDGASMRNHNHLLGRIEGLDGIKTGYTRSSGFNLMTNVRRDGHHIVGVVLGGTSAAGRDRIMANLIEDHLPEASTGEHTAPVLADVAEHPRPAVVAEPVARPPVKPVSLASGQTNEDARLPATVQAYSSTATPRWSVASKLVQVAAERQEQAAAESAQADAAPAPQAPPAQAASKVFTDRVPQKSASLPDTAPLPPTKSETPKAIVAKLEPAKAEATKVEAAKAEATKVEAAKVEAAKPEAGMPQVARLTDDVTTASIAARPKLPARLGWMIQLGAMPEEAKATELIERARTSGVKELSKAEPFTEKVMKDGTTLFRARFAGFDEDAAQSACKLLKRNGFACFATRS
jgi:D-alanyl-D-alanine carboxypeptidase